MGRVISKLSTSVRLTPGETLLALEAALSIIIARAMVTFIPMRFWRHQVGSLPEGQSGVPVDDQLVKAIAQSIARACRNLPGETRCLAQAIAARAMLARRDIASRLSIGLADKGGAIRKYHAWLTVNGRFVTGTHADNEYQTMTGAAEAR